MITRIKSTRIILEDSLLDGYVYFDGERITAVTTEELPHDAEYDFGDRYVSPGFIDIHTHGAGGNDFIDGDPDTVIRGAEYHLAHGTTSILPTLSAAPIDQMENAVKAIREAKESGRCHANIIGAHLEGPYFSPEQCGAQCTDYMTDPIPADYTRLVETYGNAIARWSYAPERDTDGSFAAYLTSHGVLAAAGHTNAIYDDMLRAEKNGCSLVTHLYSATSTITRKGGFRRLGVIESALLSDDMYVEIIADGRHLPPELIRLILKVKGTDKVALITDSLSIAGTDVKHGFMLKTEYIIEDGVCKLVDRSAFAGSIATADMLVRVVSGEAGVPLVDTVKMITKVPAEILRVNKGVLAAGRDADIVVFDDGINVTDIFVMGKKVK